MEEPTSDKNYEENFESSLLKLIRQRAEVKDISYDEAAKEVAELRERETREKELQGD